MGAFVGYFSGAIYAGLLVIGFALAKALFDAPADGLSEKLANGGTIMGFGLMITLLAPFAALIMIPALVATAGLASLASAYLLAKAEGSPRTRRNLALVCGAATGLALWAASQFVGKSLFATPLWLLPAPLAALTLNRFLFADFARLGYREP